MALQGVCIHYHENAGDEDIKKVRTDWISDQSKYYRKSVERREKAIKKLSNASVFAFFLGIVAILFVLSLRWEIFLRVDESWLTMLDFLVGLLPAMAGLLSGYLEFAAYEEDVREHTLARDLFEQADRELDRLDRAEDEKRRLWEKKMLIRQLGIEALREHADWALLHKSHDAKAPMG